MKNKLMQKNIPGDNCPVCNSPEIESNTPRTVYKCGSSDYDNRPNTFIQKCEPMPHPIIQAEVDELRKILSLSAVHPELKDEIELVFTAALHRAIEKSGKEMVGEEMELTKEESNDDYFYGYGSNAHRSQTIANAEKIIGLTDN